MSLQKSIEHGKEKRKPYHRAKALYKSCRNHGSCGYCRANRLHSSAKKILAYKNAVENYDMGDNQ